MFYPTVVIGAGAGGLVVALGLARAGKKVLLIEKGHWGGDCTNFGCIPSKTLIAEAKRHRPFPEALKKVREVVGSIRAHEEPESLEKQGVETLTAAASFKGSHTIEAKAADGKIDTIEAKKIVIATGSSPRIPAIEGLLNTPFLTNETVFDLEEAPKSLIVLGGGPIGSELAQAFQRLGVSVKLVHKHPQILGREPKEASSILIEKFRKEGMKLFLGCEPKSVRYEANLFHVQIEGREISAEKLLVSVGREPNLKDLNLEKGGVDAGSEGIVIDPYGRTSQKHIFAVGDAVGPPFFTHLAENRARAVLTTLLLSPFWKKKIDAAQGVPRVTLTDPEAASIGLSEEEAIQHYGQKKIAVYTVPMSKVDRALTEGTEGFLKIITRKVSSRILGASVVSPRAGEMLGEISLAMYAKIPLRKLAGLIHAYPTYNLAIRRAADFWLTQTLLPMLRRKK